ncbi:MULTISPECIES: right-handed parallel beta-helix repeat-containing protein [unclassified Wenzhouxiangella]|uniref:CSLREA domain-containing protein n=1 Tax=unclassified Wenzhouxiangella TaxID=2613841 RepID=UPI000E3269FF|nr:MULTISPECIES: right-handed parallel beta-helix repeat-containing protein [unclassified Wenzhouxiangella]RFF28464.1 right-handed parallel beta-helix repeat-containing protein [Wenzhouxiangella sp. 15181]RFP69981.1 right-handed parallel beta-helix repeat-containing protein [Wenzhouxiangella sp. 15190]
MPRPVQTIRTARPAILTLLFLLLSSAFTATASAQAFAFTVTSTDDDGDADLNDGACVDQSGECTLRAAIEQANALIGGTAIIDFDLSGAPPFIIDSHAGSLHIQRDDVLIDGSSQSTAPNPEIEIRGPGITGSSHDGFHIEGDNNEIRGLSIIEFDGDGIFIDGSVNIVTENLIGVDTAGNRAGNGGNGIRLTEGSSYNRIGEPGQGNVISDNSQRGIAIGLGGADMNTIQSNIIGAAPDGKTAMGNFMEGILVNQGNGNIIGGDRTQNEGNLIVDNGRRGILATSSDETSIRGNLVGVNADGDAMGNDGPGIEVRWTNLSQVGEAPPEEMGNVVADNNGAGVLLEGSGSTGNIIAANELGGIDLSGGPLIIHANDGPGMVDHGTKTTIGGNGSDDGNQFWSRGMELHGKDGFASNNNITACDNTGIYITGSEYGIGSSSALTQNIINACDGPAISIVGSGAIENRIERNSMQNNDGPGIDLGNDGVDENDPGDDDTGPNNRQNSPELITADYDFEQDELTVTFKVDSTTGNSAYDLKIDFYRDNSSTTERQSLGWLGSALYENTDAQSEVTVTVSGLPTIYQEGEVIATATDADGNTSEFSNALRYGGIFDDRFEQD